MWFWIALLAAVLWAIAVLIDEYTIDRYINNPLINAMIYSLIGLVSGIFIFMLVGPYPITMSEITWALIAGAAYTITIALYFIALKQEEATRVLPLISTSAVATWLFAALFLGESFAPPVYLGIALIVMGSVVISIKKTKSKNKKSGFGLSKAAGIVLLGSLFSGISAVIEKYLLNQEIPFHIVFGYTRIGVAIPAIILFFFIKDEVTRLFREKKHHLFGYMMTSETITILGTFVLFWALALGPVTLVSAIVTSEPLFVLAAATAIGIFFPKILKQELNRGVIIQKIIATLLIVLGLIMIGGE